MCRMVLLWGDFESVSEPIFRSLSDVAENDPLARNDNEPFSHKDGWGVLNISNERIKLERYGNPLTLGVSPPDTRKGVALIHVRAAAKGEGMGILNAHPFHMQDETYDVYITHNGWFDKYKINKLLKLGSVKNMNDSEVFLKLVMTQKGSVENRVRAALRLSRKNGYMKGGANVYVVSIKRGTNEVSIIYHTDTSQEKTYGEYNKLYFIKGKTWTGVTSSSLRLSRYFPKEIEMEELKRGKIYTAKMDLSN